MNHTLRAAGATRRAVRACAIGVGIIAAAVTGTVACQAVSSTHSFGDIVGDDSDAATTAADRVVTEADGALPDRVTVRDTQYRGIANLSPNLLQSLRVAADDAGYDGVTFYVNTGWRSPKYQNALLADAVAKYGSEEEAARWVATADTSAHVAGDAVDIGSVVATTWLSEHGASYGLCQIYENEPWHYEWRPDATDQGCPPAYIDPTYDPRMQSSAKG